MIRFIFPVIVIIIVYLIVKLIFKLIQKKQCSGCNGKGYWVETRGDRVHCKDCDGTGFS